MIWTVAEGIRFSVGAVHRHSQCSICRGWGGLTPHWSMTTPPIGDSSLVWRVGFDPPQKDQKSKFVIKSP